MTPNLKAALQESLKQEDAAVKARLQEPAPQAAAPSAPKAPKAAKPAAKRAAPAKPAAKPKAAAPAKAEKAERAKPAVKKAASPKAAAPKAKAPAEPKPAPAEAPKAQKVSRESFSLPENEAATLKGLRTAVAREGQIVTKSELLRAGLQLLTGLGAPALIAAVQALPPVAKKKKKK